jgi:hypothetical protein
MALEQEIKAAFRWAYEIGIGNVIDNLIASGAGMDEVVSTIRTTPEWEAVFPGFYRDDGSKRYGTEAEYLARVSDYRDVLRAHGSYDPAQDNPYNYVGFMELEVDPNELEQRFQMYEGIKNGSQAVKDAFYVYAGMKVTDDDLYAMVVDPKRALEIENEYNQQTAATPLDYETYITRATEVAQQHLVDQVGYLVKQGLATEAQLQQVVSGQPDVNRQYMDILYTAGAEGGSYMDLNELVLTFTYAMLGSAASEQGLILPTRERLAKFVEAGVNRSRAMQAYGAYSVAQYGLAGMASRANVQEIDQSLFEEAMLLNQGDASAALDKALGLEDSLGQAGGGFSTQLEGKRLTQSGRR